MAELSHFSQLISETDRTNATTTKAYNLNGQLTLITDAQSKATAYAYNVLGQRTGMTYSDTGVQSVIYSPAGYAVETTMPSGRKRVSTFDSFRGLVTSVDYKNPAGTVTRSDSFSYDSLSRKTATTSPDGNRAWTYDAYGRLSTESTIYSSKTYTVTRAYDNRSREVSQTYPSGRVVAKTFDELSRLETLAVDATVYQTLSYNPVGQTSAIAGPVATAFTYDDVHRETGRSVTVGSSAADTMNWSYDDNNNVTSDSSSALAAYNTTWNYDDQDRFTNWSRSGQGDNINFTRSAIGNITAENLLTRDYDDAHALTDVGSNNQSFDDDGNATLLATGLSCVWNDAGKMSGVTVPGTASAGTPGSAQYGYDAEGNRIWKKVLSPSATATSHRVYVLSDQNVIGEYNAGVAASTPAIEYIYWGGIDSLAMIVGSGGSQKLSVIRNRQWSITALAEITGPTAASIVERYTYQTYGNRTILAANGTTVRTVSSYGNDYGYTSREHLPESGLMYFRARYFDVGTGEFASRDPLEFFDGMSLYRGYFLPKAIDPSGNELENDAACTFVGRIKVGTVQVELRSVPKTENLITNPAINSISFDPDAYCKCSQEYDEIYKCSRTHGQICYFGGYQFDSIETEKTKRTIDTVVNASDYGTQRRDFTYTGVAGTFAFANIFGGGISVWEINTEPDKKFALGSCRLKCQQEEQAGNFPKP